MIRNSIENMIYINESSPLEQFSILFLPFIHLPNSILFSLFALFIFIATYYLSKNNNIIINQYQYFLVLFTESLNKVFMPILSLYNQQYFPFVFNFTLFILLNNLIGLIPYSFTPTSQLIITFLMSSSVIIGITILGLIIHKHRFIQLFMPKGIPIAILPIIMIIEIISYISRVVSLSIRLTANMVAGHTILNIISSFGFSFHFILQTLIIPMIIVIFSLEIGVSIIQAIVFGILISTYIRDIKILH